VLSSFLQLTLFIVRYAKDRTGRSAFDIAVPSIKDALKLKLLFLGRYEIGTGPPVHKSATCVMIRASDERAEEDYRKQFQAVCAAETTIGKSSFMGVLRKLGIIGQTTSEDDDHFNDMFARFDADESNTIDEDEFVKLCKKELDNGGPLQVVLKLMKRQDQFEREVSSRDEKNLDSNYVVGTLATIDPSNDRVVADLQEAGLGEYKFGIVMDGADRNLDAIFRSERLILNSVRVYAQQVGGHSAFARNGRNHPRRHQAGERRPHQQPAQAN